MSALDRTVALNRTRQAMAARASALCVDLGIPEQHPAEGHREFVGGGLSELCRLSARARGEEPFEDLARAIGHELTRTAWGTSDFGAIVQNIAHQQAIDGYRSAPVAFSRVCREGSLANFLPEGRVILSGIDLSPVGQNGEVRASGAKARSETIALSSYAATVAVTRQLLLGDDPGAFARWARAAGAAAAAKKDSVFIAALTAASGAGPTMGEDSVALFNTATHGNYVSSSGAPPTVATVGAAFAAMRTRKDPQTQRALNIPPRILLVPAALEPQARILAASWNSTLGDNEGDLTVVASGLLDAVSPAAWYLFADPTVFDVWEVGGLQGSHVPVLEPTKLPPSMDGIGFRIRADFGFCALDWRTQYRNIGA